MRPRRLIPGEVAVILPDTMQDDRKLARNGDLGAALADARGECVPPGFQLAGRGMRVSKTLAASNK